VKLTTHLCLVPRSKNGWSCTSTLPIRLHGVVLRGSTGTTLPFTNGVNGMEYWTGLRQQKDTAMRTPKSLGCFLSDNIYIALRWKSNSTRPTH
jgi:hypothetical protein